MAGLPHHLIAKQVGYEGASSVSKAIKRALDERMKEPVEGVRALEVERCNRLLQALWRDGMEGRYLAIDRILRVMERKAQLQGLDAPVRRELNVITHDTFTDFLKESRQKLKELEAAQPEGVIDASYIDEDDDTEAATVQRLSAGA